MIPTLTQSGALFTVNHRDDWLAHRLGLALRFETKLLRNNLSKQRRLRFQIRFLKLRVQLRSLTKI